MFEGDNAYPYEIDVSLPCLEYPPPPCDPNADGLPGVFLSFKTMVGGPAQYGTKRCRFQICAWGLPC